MESTWSEVETLLNDAGPHGPSKARALELCTFGEYVTRVGALALADLELVQSRLQFWWPGLMLQVQLQMYGASGIEIVLRDLNGDSAVLLR